MRRRRSNEVKEVRTSAGGGGGGVKHHKQAGRLFYPAMDVEPPAFPLHHTLIPARPGGDVFCLWTARRVGLSGPVPNQVPPPTHTEAYPAPITHKVQTQKHLLPTVVAPEFFWGKNFPSLPPSCLPHL